MPSLQHHVVARVLPLLRRNGDPHDVPRLREALIEENRRKRDRIPRRVLRHRAMSISHDAGFPVHTLVRDNTKPARSVLYLHGGGYVHPSDPAHWSFVTRLADAIGARVVFPAYPLAPEATVEDSFDALLELYARTAAISPDGVVIGGDSAGGGLALALAEAIRDRGLTPPSQLVLLAPWVDLSEAPGTREAAARDPWLSYEHLPLYAGFWAGGVALDDPRVSPGLGDLHGLPPTLMFCGTRDLLQPGCDQLFERADAADWSVEYVVGPGLIHVYPLLPIPEARTAFEQVVAFLG